MAFSGMMSASDVTALRCRAGAATDVTSRPACLGPALHRTAPLRMSAQRRPFSSAALRCSAQHSDRHSPSQSAAAASAAPAPRLRQACFDSVRLLEASAPLWLLSALPAGAADFSQGSASSGSYYATLLLFVATLPGLWSLVKRAPKASVKRKVFEVDGPGVPGAVPLDARARAIFDYFKQYNYEVKERGEVITFVGNYQASRGQAAALVSYVFFGLGSAALVLSIAAPFGGNWWYLITLISPAAGAYYLRQGNRQEEFKVKMVTADDEQTTDIITSGDVEETTRFCRELALQEKGKEYVKGILER